MKKTLLILGLVVLSAGLTVQAQEYCAPRVAKYKAQDEKNGIETDRILFVGSSTFDGWQNIESYFPEYKITNRGISGSSMRDVLYYYDVVVRPHKPYQIIVYEGDNDLNNPNYSVEEYVQDMKCFIRLSQINFPGVDICLVSIKPSPSRREAYPKYMQANEQLKKMCENNPKLRYIETWSRMVDKKGNVIDKDIYRSDSLHFTPKGYDLWSGIIAPYLIKK